jgi:leucyl-tRNA synthetase
MIVEKYGADTLRMYEMFLGPVEQSKPWDTNGIDGVHRFLKKFWSLFYDRNGQYLVTDEAATKEELKSLHKLIKKVTFDIEHFSYNTSISAFMICVNELNALKSTNKEVLSQLLVVLAPFAPHITEELWHEVGNTTTICDAQWPTYNEEYLKEDKVTYAVSFNGKARYNIEVAADTVREEVEKIALAHEGAAKWIDGKQIRKIIVVPGKIVNIVVG